MIVRNDRPEWVWFIHFSEEEKIEISLTQQTHLCHTEAELSTVSNSVTGSELSLASHSRMQPSRSTSVLNLPSNNRELEMDELLHRTKANGTSSEKRMTESWSPKQSTSMVLVPPDPDFVALKRRLRRSRENIRQSRTDFFSSPSITRTPTPNDLLFLRRDKTDTLWENQTFQIDRLSVPSICVTNNSGGSPMSVSEGDDLDVASTSSMSLRYFSEDEGVELRRPSSPNLYTDGPVTRSHSFQEQGRFPSSQQEQQSTGRFVVKRVVSEDAIVPVVRASSEIKEQRGSCPHPPTKNCGLSPRVHSASTNDMHAKPHVVSRLLAKMRRITLEWRRANKSRRGELSSCHDLTA